MGSGRKQARQAREASEAAAQEARTLRADIAKKEAQEREKVQRKLIRITKGKFNPFEFLPGVSTLGGTQQNGNT